MSKLLHSWLRDAVYIIAHTNEASARIVPIDVAILKPSENSDKPCDTGSPISTMAKEFPDFDFSKVDPLYPDKTSSLPSNPYAFTRRAILARGQACLQSLYSRSERVIAVVSHAGFLRAAVCNRRFANADWRIFEYDEDEMRKCNEGGDGLNERVLYLLKEWKETEERGGGMGRSEIGTFGPETVDFPVEVREEEAREVPTQMASREN